MIPQNSETISGCVETDAIQGGLRRIPVDSADEEMQIPNSRAVTAARDFQLPISGSRTLGLTCSGLVQMRVTSSRYFSGSASQAQTQPASLSYVFMHAL